MAGFFDGEGSVDVTVTLGGEEFTHTADTDGCRWTVCFGDPESSEGPLPPGNHLFEVRQFDVDGTIDSTRTSHSVPQGSGG